MIWLTSRLNVKPSDERTVIVLRFASSLWASVLPVAEFSTTLCALSFGAETHQNIAVPHSGRGIVTHRDVEQLLSV